MERGELIRRIKQTAYLEGEFTLRSGRKSNYYLDKYRFETQPDILAALGREFAKHVQPSTTLIAGAELGREFARFVQPSTTLIAGAELGGVALAAATSLAAIKPFVIVRNSKKGYGTGNLFEGVIKAGDSVLLVEDIATTGGQVIEAAQAICEVGAKVERIVAVIDRQEGARENITEAGFEFNALFTKADLGITA